MRLRQADIGTRQQIAFADFVLVKVAERRDRRNGLRAQRRVELRRNAPARLQCLRDQVRLDRPRLVAGKSDTGQCEQGIARWRSDCPGICRDFGAAVILRLAPVADDGQLDIIRQVERQRPAHAIAFVSVDIIIRHRADVADIAVIFAVKSGQAEPAHIANGQIDDAARPIFLTVKISDFGRSFEFLRRRFAHDVDDACTGILPEQSSLRSAQHFDALDIDQIAKRFARTAINHPVDNCRHRWFACQRECRRADPAQEQ